MSCSPPQLPPSCSGPRSPWRGSARSLTGSWRALVWTPSSLPPSSSSGLTGDGEPWCGLHHLGLHHLLLVSQEMERAGLDSIIFCWFAISQKMLSKTPDVWRSLSWLCCSSCFVSSTSTNTGIKQKQCNTGPAPAALSLFQLNSPWSLLEQQRACSKNTLPLH